MKKVEIKHKFYAVSASLFLLLALVRHTLPVKAETDTATPIDSLTAEMPCPELPVALPEEDALPKAHRIWGVTSYAVEFPDLQDVQLAAAQKNGITPPQTREEAELVKNMLVYVGASPYYHIDEGMTSSIPYLVPKASRLLNRIGRNFYDSLFVKHIPLHSLIVTSVLRTHEDVQKLTSINANASRQSCHQFGTTFDICYTRFCTIQNPEKPTQRAVRDDTLKYVLSEVLRDLRADSLCYVKHEVKQSCFHITVR